MDQYEGSSFLGFVSECASTVFNFFEDTVIRPARSFAAAGMQLLPRSAAVSSPDRWASSYDPAHQYAWPTQLPPQPFVQQPQTPSYQTLPQQVPISAQQTLIEHRPSDIHSRLHSTTPLTETFTNLFWGKKASNTRVETWYNATPIPPRTKPPLFNTQSPAGSPKVIKPHPLRAYPDYEGFEFFPLEDNFEDQHRREATLTALRVLSMSHKKKTWEEIEEETKRRESIRLLEEERKKKEEMRRLEEERKKWSAPIEDEEGEVYPRRALTDREEADVRKYFSGNGSEILVKQFNIEITRSDIKSLGPGQWLNDEIVNFYMELLKENAKEKNKVQCHFFNSFFYTLLSVEGSGYNYSKVNKWTKKIDIFKMDKLIIPVHLGSHWCLASVNMKKKLIEYYDSLGGTNSHCRKCLRQYLADEYRSKNNRELDLSVWVDHAPGSQVPQQENSFDCGVFMCIFAAHVTQNKPFRFSQRDMPFFRKRILLDIMQKKFSDPR